MFDDPFFDTKSVCNVQNRFTTFISTGTPGLSRWLPRPPTGTPGAGPGVHFSPRFGEITRNRIYT